VNRKNPGRKAEPASKRRIAWPTGTGFRGITVRDWLQLLIVPFALVSASCSRCSSTLANESCTRAKFAAPPSACDCYTEAGWPIALPLASRHRRILSPE
jgi:hypothetical protein